MRRTGGCGGRQAVRLGELGIGYVFQSGARRRSVPDAAAAKGYRRKRARGRPLAGSLISLGPWEAKLYAHVANVLRLGHRPIQLHG